MQIEARGRTRRDRLSTLKSCLSPSYALPRHYVLITYFINTKDGKKIAMVRALMANRENKVGKWWAYVLDGHSSSVLLFPNPIFTHGC
jgi:hypothetical protein